VSDTAVISLDWELKFMLYWLWWRGLFLHNHHHCNSRSKNVYIF
jgi:hypothetical protein